MSNSEVMSDVFSSASTLNNTSEQVGPSMNVILVSMEEKCQHSNTSLNVTDRENYLVELKQYKKLCSLKKEEYVYKLTKDVNDIKMPHDFWKALGRFRGRTYAQPNITWA